MTDATPDITAAGTEEAPRPRWGLGDAVFAYVAGYVLAGFVSSAYLAATDTDADVGAKVVTLVALWIGWAGVPYLASRMKGYGSLARDYGLRIEARDIPLGIAAGAFSNLVLVNLVVLLFKAAGLDVDVGRQAENIVNDADGWGLAVLVPFIVVGAPLVEELLFRGLLQRSIARRLGAVAAVIGSAVNDSGLLVGAAVTAVGWPALLAVDSVEPAEAA